MMPSLMRSALAGAAQTLGVGALYLVLYRAVNASLGVERLGVWSVVVAAASAARVADLGMSVSVTRFVARAFAAGRPRAAADVIETAVLTVAAVLGAALLPAAPALRWLLGHILPPAHLGEARALVPYVLASFWLASVGAILQGGLDGCRRIDQRAALAVAGQSLMVALALALMPAYGLTALAWAQVVQGLAVACGAWLLLRRLIPGLPAAPVRWRRAVLREVTPYGANIQAAAVLAVFLDPLTRALMARFGGPAAAGYFEMAGQVVLRVRALLVAANQAAVPWFAHLAETARDRLGEAYRLNVRLLVLLALPLFALVFAWSGLLSEFFLGRRDAGLMFMLRLVGAAWLLNTANVAAYFVNVGAGDVADNTLSHLTTAAVNVALGFVLGLRYGGVGVAWAYALALVTGSWLLLVLFRRRHGTAWEAAPASDHLPLAAICAAAFLYGWADAGLGGGRGELHRVVALGVIPAALVLAVWRHPARRAVWQRLFLGSPTGP